MDFWANLLSAMQRMADNTSGLKNMKQMFSQEKGGEGGASMFGIQRSGPATDSTKSELLKQLPPDAFLERWAELSRAEGQSMPTSDASALSAKMAESRAANNSLQRMLGRETAFSRDEPQRGGGGVAVGGGASLNPMAGALNRMKQQEDEDRRRRMEDLMFKQSSRGADLANRQAELDLNQDRHRYDRFQQLITDLIGAFR